MEVHTPWIPGPHTPPVPHSPPLPHSVDTVEQEDKEEVEDVGRVVRCHQLLRYEVRLEEHQEGQTTVVVDGIDEFQVEKEPPTTPGPLVPIVQSPVSLGTRRQPVDRDHRVHQDPSTR